MSDQAPWALVKTDRDRAATVLYVALRAVDSLKVIFTPFLPHTSQQLHELLGYEGWLAGPLEFRPVVEEDGRRHEVLTGDYASWIGTWQPSDATAGAAAARAAAALPQARPVDRRRRARPHVIDTHAHLDLGEAPAVLGARRARQASERVIAVSTSIADGAERARARPAPRGRLREPRHPPARGRWRRCGAARRASRAARRRPRGRGRGDGARLLPRLRAPRRAAAPVRGAARARRRARQARRDPHAGGRRGHARGARRLRGHGHPPLLLLAGVARARARARLVRLVRRQRHLPEGPRAARGREARAAPTGCSPRPTARTSPRSRFEGAATSRPTCMHTLAAARRGARGGGRRARGADRRERDRGLPACERRPEEGSSASTSWSTTTSSG